ncbi:MAG: Helix-turn-helix domain [Flaviaesturariibacter sp.]|nr:Helix-turn-helix domain [Flaviaesturariibacter sp.]
MVIENLFDTLKGIQDCIAGITRYCQLHKISTADFYTSQQLANALSISPLTISKWKKEGKLGFSKVGRRCYYSRQDVLDLLRRYHKEGLNTNTANSLNAVV